MCKSFPSLISKLKVGANPDRSVTLGKILAADLSKIECFSLFNWICFGFYEFVFIILDYS